MAHLWIHSAARGWEELQLPTDREVQLTSDPQHLLNPRDTDPEPTASIRLLADASEAEPVWILIAAHGEDVWINDAPLALGIWRLTDRDEIRIPGAEPIYFSTENPAQIEPFDGDPVTCPRCRTAISSGSPSVRCPGCGVAHHQSEELGCWTYASHCALCPETTNLDAGYRFRPEDL